MKRNYRPQKFSEIYGQQAIIQTVKNALKMGRIANAYLFTGSRGTGKTTLARILAKALNCEQLSEECEPCGQCASCREIATGQSLDVLEIDGASNRGIDDIRNINETVSYATQGKCKVYIIDEVHMLTKEAFNALLKTLEEPPENVRFFFATTEPHKVLPTIVSRCQRFDLSRIAEGEIVEKLTRLSKEQEITIDQEALLLIAHLAEGGLRDAESLLDQMACFTSETITRETVEKTLGITPKEDFIALDDAIKKHDLPFAFTLAEKIFSSGKDLSHFLTSLAEHYRVHLHAALVGGGAPFSKEQLFDILDYLMQWLEKVNKSPFKQFHLEIVLLHIIRSAKRIPIDALVQKLEALKSGNAPQEVETPKPEMVKPEVMETPKPEVVATPETEMVKPEVVEAAKPEMVKPEVVEAPKPEVVQPEVVVKPEAVETPRAEKVAAPKPVSSSASEENLIRFASVELNGTVQK